MCALFISIEMVVRKQLQVEKVIEFEAGLNEKVTKDVLRNEDVLLQWECLSAFAADSLRT